MLHFLIGQIFEVRPLSHIDKKTGEIRVVTEVTLEQNFKDTNGFRIRHNDTVNFKQEDYELLKDKIDYFIAIPQSHIQWVKEGRAGAMMADSKDVTYMLFKENPLRGDIPPSVDGSKNSKDSTKSP